jgi:hypothetical protein
MNAEHLLRLCRVGKSEDSEICVNFEDGTSTISVIMGGYGKGSVVACSLNL